MKHLFPLCLLTIVACSSPSGEEEVVGATSEDVAPQNFLSDDEVLDGWDLLFDGSSLSGWHMYGGSSTEGSGWTVEHGAITLGPQPEDGHDLVSDADYANLMVAVAMGCSDLIGWLQLRLVTAI